MDEALRWLRRIALVLLLPHVAVAAVVLVLVVAVLFYLRGMAVGAWSIMSLPFSFSRRRVVPPFSGPHFQERVALGQNVNPEKG